MFRMSKNEEKIIIIIILLIFCSAAIYKFIVFKPSNVEVIKPNSEQKQVTLVKELHEVYVYITGEIIKPGIYIMNSGDRITDVINKAGGFTLNADAFSINLSEKIKDEQHINITKKNIENVATNVIKQSSIVGGKININIASEKELDDFLPGIGQIMAGSIVNYRNKNGKFKSIDELTKVDGIGSGKRFDRIKDLIIIN